jgi:hypothetical protein
LHGTVQLEATASDDTKLSGVEFSLDGRKIGSFLAAAPFAAQWDSRSAAEGTHVIGASVAAHQEDGRNHGRGQTTDNSDAQPSIEVLSVNCNDGGNPAADIVGITAGSSGLHFQVRANRSGDGQGRQYTVIYASKDKAGNMTEATAIVVVPHDQSR